MQDRPNHDDGPPKDEREDPLEAGIKAAFELDPAEHPAVGDSVVGALETRIGLESRIRLKDPLDASELPAEESPATAEQPEPQEPETEGRYRLVRELARGGLGVVLQGRDKDLGRNVAMKLLLDRHSLDSEMIRRLVEEAQIGGQLQHPGIVPVYDIGLRDDNRPFFTMKLVEGETLSALLDARRETGEGRMRFLRIFEQVCQTVGYAHARGVIHRDLKPSNIMVGAFGEVQVMDWGLAKVVGGVEHPAAAPLETARSRDPEDWSQAGSVMGTFAYMAPEQARGEVEQLDERCDVFGLGSILCRILTGKPAFCGKTPEEVAEQVRTGDLEPCWKRLDACSSDRALTTLARRCLAPAAADRPRDAGEVAGEVEAYLAAVAERARRSELEAAENIVRAEEAEARAVHERRARRMSLLLAATIIVALIVGVAGYVWIENSRQERVQRATEAVDAKLSEARIEMTRAATEIDPEKTLAAWDLALRLGRDARDFARTEELVPAATERVESLLVEIERGEAAARTAFARAEADRAMLDRLESISVKVTGDWNFRIVDEAYDAAFREYGIDIEVLDAEKAAARIEESAITRDLVAGMDEWANARRKRKGDANKLSRVSHLADPDPWRVELRKAYHLKDLDTIRELARAKGLAEMTPHDALLLGRALKSVGQENAAIAFLKTAALWFPDDFWINFHLATILHNMQPNRRKEAITFLRAALASSPRSVGAWSNLGLTFTLEGQRNEARHALETALALNPDDAKVRRAHGVFLYHLEGDCDAAIKELQLSIELDPDDFYTFAALGTAWQIKGDFDKAIEAYNESIERNPDQVESWSNMSLILMRRGDFETALTYVENALEHDPTDAISLYNKGLALEFFDDIDGAIAAYRSSLEQDPSPEAYNNLGLLLEEKEQPKEAIDSYRKALVIAPDHFFATKNLGMALYRNGEADEVDEAVEVLRKGVERYPNDSDMHYCLGEAFLKKGNLEAAVREFDRAIELDPENEEAKRSLEAVREKRQ